MDIYYPLSYQYLLNDLLDGTALTSLISVRFLVKKAMQFLEGILCDVHFLLPCQLQHEITPLRSLIYNDIISFRSGESKPLTEIMADG